VRRSVRYYNLEAILAVGYRVRSARGVQFRRWATERLSEYLVEGFTMDDERLKNPPGPGQRDYFDKEADDPIFQTTVDAMPSGQSILWAHAKARGREGLRFPAEDGRYEKAEMDRRGL
jgi:hypothetical protein